MDSSVTILTKTETAEMLTNDLSERHARRNNKPDSEAVNGRDGRNGERNRPNEPTNAPQSK